MALFVFLLRMVAPSSVQPLVVGQHKQNNLPQYDMAYITEAMIGQALFGRVDIYTGIDEITRDNVVDEVNSALIYHLQNVAEEEYLYWYRRGVQPVLYRTKERNEWVLNKVVENHAEEIVTFKNGYFLQEDCTYISRRDGAKSKVDKLNEYLYRSGKHIADNMISDWFHMVGKAALFVEPLDDPDVPVRAYALDPRSAFVVYSKRPGNLPVFAVNIVVVGDSTYIDVFTKDKVFRLFGTYTAPQTTPWQTYQCMATRLLSVEKNYLGHIPIIEYRYNSVNMGSFESAISLLDEINNVQSNRCDGVEQFIQSLAVAVNCQFDEGTTAADIRKAGMVALKSIGENKADFRLLTEELDQQQTQTLVDNLYDQALRICAMPTSSGSRRGTYDSTGAAAIFNNGWEQAASAARNTEDLFKQSNRFFDEIFVDVLRKKGLVNIKMTDFELNFVRNETANVQSKAQAMNTMLAAGMHPELAFAKSGISNDPVSDVKMSEKYLKMVWGDPDEKKADDTAQMVPVQAEAEQPNEQERSVSVQIESNEQEQVDGSDGQTSS